MDAGSCESLSTRPPQHELLNTARVHDHACPMRSARLLACVGHCRHEGASLDDGRQRSAVRLSSRVGRRQEARLDGVRSQPMVVGQACRCSSIGGSTRSPTSGPSLWVGQNSDWRPPAIFSHRVALAQRREMQPAFVDRERAYRRPVEARGRLRRQCMRLRVGDDPHTPGDRSISILSEPRYSG